MQSVLICDDHSLIRESVEGVVEAAWPDARTQLVADFPSAWTAMATGPSLCITDLMMPGATPLDGVTQLIGASPGTPVIVLTGNHDTDLLLQLYEAGIAGFVSKASSSQIIEAAIRVVIAGERYLPEQMLQLSSVVAKPLARAAPAFLVRLTERQRDVLRLIAAGQTNKEIARELDLSPATVKVHVAAAIAGLGATNRTDAVIMARELRLI